MIILKFEFSVFITEKRHRVRHHPNVAPAAVEVRQTPVAVRVGDGDDAVVY